MTDNAYRGSQRRAHYRVRYPSGNTPRLLLGNTAFLGTNFLVMDISEHGARVANPLRRRFPDDLFPVTLFLLEGEALKVLARVVRIGSDYVALYFPQGIPYKRILAEQLFVRNLA